MKSQTADGRQSRSKRTINGRGNLSSETGVLGSGHFEPLTLATSDVIKKLDAFVEALGKLRVALARP